MKSKAVAEIVKRLSEKHNLTEREVNLIARSQYRFLYETITGTDGNPKNYINVRLPALGIFYVSPFRRKKEQEFYDEKERKSLRTTGSEQCPEEGGEIIL